MKNQRTEAQNVAEFEQDQREKDLLGQENEIWNRSAEAAIQRIEEMNDLPPELKNLTPEKLADGLRGISFNYNNLFYRNKQTGAVNICQSGVSGPYGLPKNVRDNPDQYDQFEVNHMTHNAEKQSRENFIDGTGGIEDVKTELDTIPDWVTVEKIIAKLRYEAQNNKKPNEGTDLTLYFGETGKRSLSRRVQQDVAKVAA